MLTANQVGQDQVPREAKVDPVGNSNGRTSNPMVEGTDGSIGDQLLKNFMALWHFNHLSSMEVWMMLRGCDVKRWWETTRQRYAGRELVWLEFQEAFNENFFLESIKEQKTYEFIELVQGNKTVAQYESKFIFLAQFSPNLVLTKAKKASKFLRGLHVDI